MSDEQQYGTDWTPVGDGTPCNTWLEVCWDLSAAKSHEMFCRIIEIGGIVEWIMRDGATTVTHHSISPPKHWRWLREAHTFTTLREANKARDIEWGGDTVIPFSFWGCELAGEVGEACNIIKKLEREALGLVGSRATNKDLADELADVVICADLVAMHASPIIDLQRAVRNKFNATSIKQGFKTRIST